MLYITPKYQMSPWHCARSYFLSICNNFSFSKTKTYHQLRLEQVKKCLWAFPHNLTKHVQFLYHPTAVLHSKHKVWLFVWYLSFLFVSRICCIIFKNIFLLSHYFHTLKIHQFLILKSRLEVKDWWGHSNRLNVHDVWIGLEKEIFLVLVFSPKNPRFRQQAENSTFGGRLKESSQNDYIKRQILNCDVNNFLWKLW